VGRRVRGFCRDLRAAIKDERKAVKEYDKLSDDVFDVDVFRGSQIVLIRDDEARHAKTLEEIYDELCK